MEYCPVIFFAENPKDIPGHIHEPGRITTSKTGTDGPEGKMGILTSGCRGEFDLTYDPTNQTWTRVGDVWIGVDRRGKITPAMVQRETVYQGHQVMLDGAVWTIPVAVAVFGRCGLPQTRVLNAQGKGEWKIRDAYRDLCEKARLVWEMKNNERPVDITEDQLDDLAGEAMTVNYRFGKLELLALGLMDNQSGRDIIDALLDWPTVMAVLKKKHTPD